MRTKHAKRAYSARNVPYDEYDELWIRLLRAALFTGCTVFALSWYGAVQAGDKIGINLRGRAQKRST